MTSSTCPTCNQIPESDRSGPGTSIVSPVYKCGVGLFCWNKPENIVSVLKEYKWSGIQDHVS